MGPTRRAIGHPSHDWRGDICAHCAVLVTDPAAQRRCWLTPPQPAATDAPLILNGWPVYLVGRWTGMTGGGTILWELCGLVTTADAADQACLTHDHFYTVVRIGDPVPSDMTAWATVFPRRP